MLGVSYLPLVESNYMLILLRQGGMFNDHVCQSHERGSAGRICARCSFPHLLGITNTRDCFDNCRVWSFDSHLLLPWTCQKQVVNNVAPPPPFWSLTSAHRSAFLQKRGRFYSPDSVSRVVGVGPVVERGHAVGVVDRVVAVDDVFTLVSSLRRGIERSHDGVTNVTGRFPIERESE